MIENNQIISDMTYIASGFNTNVGTHLAKHMSWPAKDVSMRKCIQSS